jgi:hypothetical protein
MSGIGETERHITTEERWAWGPRCVKCDVASNQGIFPIRGVLERAWGCRNCEQIQVTYQKLSEDGSGKYERYTREAKGFDLQDIRDGKI